MEIFYGILGWAIVIGVIIFFFVWKKKKRKLELENQRRLRKEECKKVAEERAKMLVTLREQWDAKKEEFKTDGLPIYTAESLHLSKNENCHFIGSAVFSETKNEIVGYKGSGGDFSFELIKGLNRTYSNHQGNYITQETTEETCGTLYLTSKKIIFTAEKNSFVIRYEDLVSLNVFHGKYQFQTDTATYMLLIADDFNFGVTLEYIVNEIETDKR